MKLSDSHDIGMLLQYRIEARSDVERCFVHIDYEKRDYDEHVISKVPHLLKRHSSTLTSPPSDICYDGFFSDS